MGMSRATQGRRRPVRRTFWTCRRGLAHQTTGPPAEVALLPRRRPTCHRLLGVFDVVMSPPSTTARRLGFSTDASLRRTARASPTPLSPSTRAPGVAPRPLPPFGVCAGRPVGNLAKVMATENRRYQCQRLQQVDATASGEDGRWRPLSVECNAVGDRER